MSPAAQGGGGLDSTSVLAFLNDPTKVTALADVTDTQTAVVSGSAHYALLPKSFVVSPGGNDGNYVIPKDTAGVVTALPSTPIDQYAVVLKHGTGPYTEDGTDQNPAWKWLQYIKSDGGDAVLRAHGYDPAP